MTPTVPPQPEWPPRVQCQWQLPSALGGPAQGRLGIAADVRVVKAGGLVRYGDCLASADSLAWSFEARRSAPLVGCVHTNCANCLRYAAAWRERTGR